MTQGEELTGMVLRGWCSSTEKLAAATAQAIN